MGKVFAACCVVYYQKLSFCSAFLKPIMHLYSLVGRLEKSRL